MDDLLAQRKNAEIQQLENKAEELQGKLNELNNEIEKKNLVILNHEVEQLRKLSNDPNYEFEVQVKEEILNNLSFYKDEYKSLIKEIQDAMKVIKQNE